MIKILVPVDYSPTSANALAYAVNLFKTSNLEVTLLYAFATSSMTVTIKNIDQVIEEDSKRLMKKFMDKAQAAHPDVVLKPIVVKDHAVSAIASLGDSGEFDFIVMGTQGASGLKEVFLGSVAGGVISKSSAPVIVVPEGYSFEPLNQIVVALSDTPISDAKVADPLRMVTSMHKSKVRVLHVEVKDQGGVEAVMTSIEDLNPSLDYAAGSGDTNKDINAYLLTHNCGMLCLIRGKKGFFNRLFTESVTMKQTFHSPIPLLILHDMA